MSPGPAVPRWGRPVGSDEVAATHAVDPDPPRVDREAIELNELGAVANIQTVGPRSAFRRDACEFEVSQAFIAAMTVAMFAP